jgi:feruloyl-CoA synthase
LPNVARGFVFDGRVTEDFKLATGTWVNMAAVRLGAIGACAPLIRDIVLTGLDRNHIGALIFPDFAACRSLAGLDPSVSGETVIADPTVRAAFQQRLDALAASATGSSTHIARAILLAAPPSGDAGEITDKGSINQRAVMANRATLVEDLYAEPAPAHVMSFRRGTA